MSTPTTLRGELLKAVETFNDRYFLTLGNTGAGMTPYNPIQAGIGARLILQVDQNVKQVVMELHRVGDVDTLPLKLNPVKTSVSTWEVEGAIGGSRLGFPQPPLAYHMAQCFELTVRAKNLTKVDEKVYTFWVGEGLVGTIAECQDRKVIGTKPLIAGFDGLGWQDFMFADNYAEFYARNTSDTFVSNDDECLKGLTEDPANGVYVPGGDDIFTGPAGNPAPDNPWIRRLEPSPDSFFSFPQISADTDFLVNGLPEMGLSSFGSVFEFVDDVAANNPGFQGLIPPTAFADGSNWRYIPREPYTHNTVAWLTSPTLDFKNYENASVTFYYLNAFSDTNIPATGAGMKLQWTEDEGSTWNDFAPGDYNIALGTRDLLTVFGGGSAAIISGQSLQKIELNLSVLEGKFNARIRWATRASSVAIPSTQTGPIISGIRFSAQPSINLLIEKNMVALRAGFGPQWKYTTPVAYEYVMHGTREKARRGFPAVVHPTLGTGFVDDLVANPQIANDVGGLALGANIGYPKATENMGLEILLVGTDEASDSGVGQNLTISVRAASWLPFSQAVHLIVGTKADWVGGANLGDYIRLQNVEPADLLCAVQSGPAYWDYGSGAGPTLPAKTVAPLVSSIVPGGTSVFTIDISGLGIGVGVVLTVQAFSYLSFSAPAGGGAGYFTQLFPTSTIRSNALHFTTIV